MTGGALVPLAFGAAASGATLLGGALALRLAGRLTLITALAAGVVLGVAFFDLMPEAWDMAGGRYSLRELFACVAVGFGGYMVLDRALGSARRLDRRWRARLGPGILTLHSLLDGMGIGLAFQITPAIGWTVALAVLTHDLVDGINTVSLTLATDEPGKARRWLAVNASAPLVGVMAGLLIQVPPSLLAPLLAIFAGVFMFIGGCELMPKSHAADPRARVTWMSLAGMALMLAVSRWAA